MKANECQKCLSCRKCKNVTRECYKGFIDYSIKRNGFGEVRKYIELVLKFFEEDSKEENILDLNDFSLGAFKVYATVTEKK